MGHRRRCTTSGKAFIPGAGGGVAKFPYLLEVLPALENSSIWNGDVTFKGAVIARVSEYLCRGRGSGRSKLGKARQRCNSCPWCGVEGNRRKGAAGIKCWQGKRGQVLGRVRRSRGVGRRGQCGLGELRGELRDGRPHDRSVDGIDIQSGGRCRPHVTGGKYQCGGQRCQQG
ncbi:MAG: hypothetical protein MZV64_33000 [Ignavibacteriales bacterium]|nr:hypothetical protein [Ignavibacteriales bacterium]